MSRNAPENLAPKQVAQDTRRYSFYRRAMSGLDGTGLHPFNLPNNLLSGGTMQLAIALHSTQHPRLLFLAAGRGRPHKGSLP